MELLLPELQQLIYIVEQMVWIVFRFFFPSFLCLLYTTYLAILSSTVSYPSCSVVYFIFALYLDAPVVLYPALQSCYSTYLYYTAETLNIDIIIYICFLFSFHKLVCIRKIPNPITARIQTSKLQVLSRTNTAALPVCRHYPRADSYLPVY